MNEIARASEFGSIKQAAETFFSHYELWLAERMPADARDAVFWQDEKINYDQLRDDLQEQRRYFIAPSPYPGLRSFTPQEGRVFFGRPSDVEEVRARLKAHRMVMVLGGSGSGKSSLIRAGLLPHLNGVGRIAGRGGIWYWCEFRPEQQPIDNLAKALARHVVAPLVRAIRARGDPTEDVTRTCASLQLRLNATPDEIEEWVAEQLSAPDRRMRFDSLWDFVDDTLDQLDELASAGVRSGKPNILILLDQFEEVFRDGPTEEQQEQVEDLLCLLARMEERLRGPPGSEGGLFMAITTRSEELHRCGEHDGLTQLVNRSVFLLELLDADRSADRKVLHRAIVEPARRVFTSYKLPFDREDPDSPFAPGVPDWLIEGSSKQWATLEHRPDQLPLLQHALRAMWHQAVGRWKKDGPQLEFLIQQTDLPGDDPATSFPDLDLCLSSCADKAADEARGRFADFKSQDSPNPLSADQCVAGELALRSAFSVLARQDDRKNRARRFGTLDEMLEFLGNYEQVDEYDSLRERLERALSPMIFHGYLTGGGDRPYDISHEALIRNWDQCSRWLLEVEEIVRSLRRFIDDIDPKEFEKLTDSALIAENSSGPLSVQIAKIGSNMPMPESWARHQLDLMLRVSADRRRRWLGEHRAHDLPTIEDAAAILSRMQQIAAKALLARTEVREANARADERKKQLEIVRESARRAEESAKKARKRMKLAAGFAVVSLAGLAGTAFLVGSVTASSQVLADGSALGRAANESLPHGARLGILEMTRPVAPSWWWRWLQPNAQADALFLQWDGLARSSLGANFWLTDIAPFAPPRSAVCWTRSAEGWQSSSRGLNDPITVALTNRRMQVVSSGPTLMLSIEPAASGTASGDEIDLLQNAPLPTLSPGSQLCMSHDASIVTVSSPENPVPNIYEHILHCSDRCQSSLLPIRPSIVPPRPNSGPAESDSLTASAVTPVQSGSPHVTRIGTSPDGVAGINFLVGGRSFWGQFYRGWATPRRIGGRPSSAEACEEETGQRLPGRTWRCSGATPYVTVGIADVPDGPLQDGAELVTLEARTRNNDEVTPRLTALVPPGIGAVAIDADVLILTDDAGDFWAINVGDQRLTSLVARLGDRNNIPDEIYTACVSGWGCANAPLRHGSERRSK